MRATPEQQEPGPRIGASAQEAFRASFRGQLVLPSDETYDRARRVWNGCIDKRPALIARCSGVVDVIRAVEFAREHDLIVAVRGGGHNVAGHGTCDGGMVIDLSPMRGMSLDLPGRTIKVQAGATWGDVDHETQAFGLATTGGLVSSTGVTAGGELGNVIRRAVAPRLHLVLGLNELATDSQTPPLGRSDLVVRPRLGRTLAGGLCPNAILDGDRRFDDVAAGRFAIVMSTEPSLAQRAETERRGAAVIAAHPGSELHRWLRRGRSHAVLVRPDGTVLCAGQRLSVLLANLPRARTNTGSGGSCRRPGPGGLSGFYRDS